MKSPIILIVLCFTVSVSLAQGDKQQMLKELSVNACNCVDSIKLSGRSKADVSQDVNECIKDAANGYQLGAKIIAAAGEPDKKTKNKKKKKKDKDKVTEVTLDFDPDSKEFEQYYFELERYMMENCPSLQNAARSDNAMSDHSMSDNPSALKLYESANAKSNAGNFTDAIADFKSALAIDSMFSFAWDNLGVAYRKSEKYDLAIQAYRKSLEVTPSGKMPLQNIAIVYEYQKEYQKAIDAYEQLAARDSNDPEVYYGIGRLYAGKLLDLEKGLDNLCTAYTLYVEQRSPYRTDAEKLISAVASEMKKQGKEKRFYEILQAHHLDPK